MEKILYQLQTTNLKNLGLTFQDTQMVNRLPVGFRASQPSTSVVWGERDKPRAVWWMRECTGNQRPTRYARGFTDSCSDSHSLQCRITASLAEVFSALTGSMFAGYLTTCDGISTKVQTRYQMYLLELLITIQTTRTTANVIENKKRPSGGEL